ncbi:MAG TPA: hypothetical protein VFM27_10795 [Acidimicrobiales bacterium]|nr:hypothetical protein [Acidimicrobiales bacterium]
MVDRTSAARVRPQMLPLLAEDPALPRGLRLVHETDEEGRETRVFRLDPPPGPVSTVAPGLGFMGDG